MLLPQWSNCIGFDLTTIDAEAIEEAQEDNAEVEGEEGLEDVPSVTVAVSPTLTPVHIAVDISSITTKDTRFLATKTVSDKIGEPRKVK